jgi:quercetin dioxygenase-like cupin family protein
MMKRSLALAGALSALSVVLSGAAFAQAPAAGGAALRLRQDRRQRPAGRGGGNQGVGSQGDPDPGVHFVVVVDNPQFACSRSHAAGSVRRPHVHNDVTFHMLVPVTGSLELTVDGTVVPTVPGQAYYMVKGQTHGFTNKTAARFKS